VEHLFSAGDHFLMAHAPVRMRVRLKLAIQDRAFASSMVELGRKDIFEHPTRAQRLAQPLQMTQELGVSKCAGVTV